MKQFIYTKDSSSIERLKDLNYPVFKILPDGTYVFINTGAMFFDGFDAKEIVGYFSNTITF